MLFNLNLAYIYKGNIIRERYKIIKKYLRQNFLYDIVFMYEIDIHNLSTVLLANIQDF